MNDYLYKPTYDKLLHFFYGAVIGAIAVIYLAPIYAFLLVLVIGLIKEVVDYVSSDGTVDVFDVLWTIAGGLIAIL